ncbi:MAG: sulfatase-like hydrolase/transferase [Polyangiaceae bacterium]|nr:sulfatase-like hydrolase/transferase [Polyangiaceae bacterium]
MADDSPALRRAPAIGLGFALVALAGAIVVAYRRSKGLPPTALAMVEVHVVGYAALCGAAAAALAVGWERLLTLPVGPVARRPRTAAVLAVALVGGAVGIPLLDIDASGVAGRVAEELGLPYEPLLGLFAFGGGMTVAVALALGLLLARPWLRWLGVAAGAALATTNGFVLSHSYEGVHVVLAVSAGTLAGASLAGMRLRWGFARTPRWVGRVVWGIAAVLGLASVLVSPSNRASVELARQPVAFLAPFPLLPQDDIDVAWQPPPEEAEWFQSRAGLDPVPPSGKLLIKNPIVIMIGIDSMRADVLADEANRTKLPTLFQLRDEGVWFSNARSPGTSTGPAIAAIFSGVTYSAQRWVRHPKRPAEPFPHLDETPRFPETISAAGIPTITVDAAGWLTNEFGVVRGFTNEESLRKPGSNYPRANVMLPALTPKILESSDGPLFAFAHLLDAHSPYTSVRSDGTKFENYLAELGFVDAQLRDLKSQLVKKRLWNRTILIVYSDHGEAFGEHGLTFHGQALYDELLRVPLIIRTPTRGAKVVDAPVSLLDLGPTILDLFNLETPPHAMGQSLVPLMRGTGTTLTRPIVAEARLKRAMLIGDTKVIHDSRMRTVEVFDLAADPGENDNLYDPDLPASQAALGALLRYFEEHTFKRPGYRVPYRKW